MYKAGRDEEVHELVQAEFAMRALIQFHGLLTMATTPCRPDLRISAPSSPGRLLQHKFLTT